MLSYGAKQAVDRALGLANERRRGEAAVEHLLLALTEDADARALLEAVGTDIGRLRADLVSCIDHQPGAPAPPDATRQGEGFQRTLERARIHVLSTLQSGDSARGEFGPRPRTSDKITGADLLVAIFSEKASRAVAILKDNAVKRLEILMALNFPDQGDGDRQPP